MMNYKEENMKKLERARTITDTKYYIKDMNVISFEDTKPETFYFERGDFNVEDDTKSIESLILEKNDSLGYVIKHINDFEGRRPLVLNFANPVTPGGGVRKGCRAQEEDICRRTDLLKYLESEQASEYYEENRDDYKYGHRGFERGLLTKDVTIFVDSNGKLMDKPITIDVLTVAAPYNEKDDINVLEITEPFIGNMDNIIEMILDTCQAVGYKDIVLGAFGCGAFNNDPTITAMVFQVNFNTGKYDFKTVGFPILVHSDRDERNWEAFQKVLK